MEGDFIAQTGKPTDQTEHRFGLVLAVEVVFALLLVVSPFRNIW